MTKNNQGEIIIYQADDGTTKIDVKIDEETVWLTQQQLCDLYATSKSNVSEHIKHIFEEGELDEQATVRKFRTVQKEGAREVSREQVYYNLDLIISLGYRIKSQIATNFRIWATKRLKEYILKGFTMDDDRLKGSGGGNYWRELLERIKDIRSSEKVLYRQVLDLYATSLDYDPKCEDTITFFKIVQNKLHYATHGNTAAELIYNRADARKDFMGLTNFSGDFPTKKDVTIAKNYLNQDELRVLNNLVSAYFDIAELNAIEHKPMYMSDYIATLDNLLSTTGRKLLENSGKVSSDLAKKKAIAEYEKFRVNNLSPIENEYLETIKKINAAAKDKAKENK